MDTNSGVTQQSLKWLITSDVRPVILKWLTHSNNDSTHSFLLSHGNIIWGNSEKVMWLISGDEKNNPRMSDTSTMTWLNSILLYVMKSFEVTQQSSSVIHYWRHKINNPKMIASQQHWLIHAGASGSRWLHNWLNSPLAPGSVTVNKQQWQ